MYSDWTCGVCGAAFSGDKGATGLSCQACGFRVCEHCDLERYLASGHVAGGGDGKEGGFSGGGYEEDEEDEEEDTDDYD